MWCGYRLYLWSWGAGSMVGAGGMGRRWEELKSENNINILKSRNMNLTFRFPWKHVVVLSLSCVWLCNPMDCSMSDFPVLHYFLEFTQTRVHWLNNAIQPSRLLSPSSPLALNLSQHQGLFQWLSSLHQMAKVLELQLQHQSFQWIFSVDFL